MHLGVHLSGIENQEVRGETQELGFGDRGERRLYEDINEQSVITTQFGALGVDDDEVAEMSTFLLLTRKHHCAADLSGFAWLQRGELHGETLTLISSQLDGTVLLLSTHQEDVIPGSRAVVFNCPRLDKRGAAFLN